MAQTIKELPTTRLPDGENIRMAGFARLAMAMARALGVEDAREPMDFIRALEALQRACGVADLRMSDYGISPDEFPAMVRNARETMGFLFPFDREPLSDEECEAIYRASYR